MAALTSRGTAGIPAISRADARFGTGCMTSPTRTYIAPDSRTMTMGSVPRLPCGRSSASTAHTATTIAASTMPAPRAMDWLRIGSSSIRTSRYTNAYSILRDRKR